ncbi:MAG: phosphomethylpyrimidine synthase ThiC [Gammaproteobacteria bacterium]
MVSRESANMVNLCLFPNKENCYYTQFEQFCDFLKFYKQTLFLEDGFHFRCITNIKHVSV